MFDDAGHSKQRTWNGACTPWNLLEGEMGFSSRSSMPKVKVKREAIDRWR